MSSCLLAFLGASAFFVPASSVLAPSTAASTPVQSVQSRFGGASRAQMIDLRNRFSGAIDSIRTNLERRLLALDLSNPAMVTEFVDGQRMLEAWDTMATFLPENPAEQLEASRTALIGLSRLAELQGHIAATASSTTPETTAQISQRGGNTQAIGAAGVDPCAARPPYNGGVFASDFIVAISNSLVTTLRDFYNDSEEMLLLPFPSPGSGGPVPYPPGLPGERATKQVQALLDFYSTSLPRFTVPLPPDPQEGPRQLEIPNPLKVFFDSLAHANRNEMIRAEFMNADNTACQLANVSDLVSGLATAIDALDVGEVRTKLDSVITKVDSRASATDLASFRTDVTDKVLSRASAIDLASFRTDTGSAFGNVRTDIAIVRAGATVAFQNLGTKVDTRASFLEAAVAARANELMLKLHTAEAMLFAILDEVD